jgi:glucosamine kinase
MAVARADRRALTVGVDAGGTWIRVTSRTPKAHHARLPAQNAELSQTIRRALRSWGYAQARIDALVVGSRGVWTGPERRRLERDLRTIARRARVISDVEAAYEGALGSRAGVLIVAGTGSIAIGRNAAGRWARAGGLGPILGDEGSAFWIGREWLRATMSTRARDFGRARALARGPAATVRIAALAPRVLDRARRGDRRAAGVARDAQQHLALLVRRVASTLRLSGPVAVSWAGTLLTRSAWFRTGVAREVARAGLESVWVEPRESPDRAAARLAHSMVFRSTSSGRRGRSKRRRSP